MWLNWLAPPSFSNGTIQGSNPPPRKFVLDIFISTNTHAGRYTFLLCLFYSLIWWDFIYVSFVVSAIVKTAGAKEFGYFEQAHQRWLLLHVPAFVSYWDRGSGCCHILTDQIFVITTMANTAFSLYYVVLGVNWLLLLLSWLLTIFGFRVFLWRFFACEMQLVRC